ncbi:unnamed protein product, partial [marine sediment metagenome]
ERVDIPVRYAFEHVKLLKKLADDFTAIEEQRIGLIKKYGEEKDGQIKIEPEKNGKPNPDFVKFVSEFNELMKIENEIVIKKVNVPDNISISGQDLAVLEPFIEIITL